MTCYQEAHCQTCDSNKIVKIGTSAKGVQRYICQNGECSVNRFMLEYSYKAYEPGVKGRVVDMVTNGSGIRDTARVLKISKGTVISTLKKRKLYNAGQPLLAAT